MSVYRVVWRSVTSVLVIACVLVAVAVASIPRLIAVFGTAALLGALVTVTVSALKVPAPARRLAARCAAHGVLSGLCVVAVLGAAQLIGPLVLLVVVLMAATSPPVVRRAINRLRHREHTSEAIGAAASAVSVIDVLAEPGPADEGLDERLLAQQRAVRLLSNAELCAAWTTSCAQLRAAAPAEVLRLVQKRQCYLDELERRDPDGLHAWLASTASAAGDPLPFISHTDPNR